MNSVRILLSILFTFSFSPLGLAINKCTDDKGNVSFQDSPCKPGHKSEVESFSQDRDSDNVNNLNPVYVEIPGVGTAVLFSYKWWSSRVIQADSAAPPTVKMIAKNGEEPLSLSITFLPNRMGRKIPLEESVDTVHRMASRYVEGSVEREVIVHKLDTSIGPAVLASFNDAKYLKDPVPAGEYSSITVGQAAHSKLIVGFTILTNGTNSKALTEALNILGSFQVVAKE